MHTVLRRVGQERGLLKGWPMALTQRGTCCVVDLEYKGMELFPGAAPETRESPEQHN